MLHEWMPAPMTPEETEDPLLPDPRGRLPPTPWLVWLMGAAACAALILVVTLGVSGFLDLLPKS